MYREALGVVLFSGPLWTPQLKGLCPFLLYHQDETEGISLILRGHQALFSVVCLPSALRKQMVMSSSNKVEKRDRVKFPKTARRNLPPSHEAACWWQVFPGEMAMWICTKPPTSPSCLLRKPTCSAILVPNQSSASPGSCPLVFKHAHIFLVLKIKNLHKHCVPLQTHQFFPFIAQIHPLQPDSSSAFK